jgi:hypothetical protein
MKWMLFKLCIALLACGLSTNVFASVKTLVCNDCSELSMSQTALKEAVEFTLPYIIVVDIKNKVAQKYRVEQNNHTKPILHPIDMSTIEQREVNLFYSYTDELVSTIKKAEQKNQLQPARTLPISIAKMPIAYTDKHLVYAGHIDGNGSIYDFLQASYLRNDLHDVYFKEHIPALKAANPMALKAIKIPSMNDLGVFLTIDFNSTEEFNQPQNSFLNISLDIVSSSFFIQGGRDGFNNSIPMTIKSATGVFYFADMGEKDKFEAYIRTLANSDCAFSVSENQVDDKYIYQYICH